jgi:hypothetical protein
MEEGSVFSSKRTFGGRVLVAATVLAVLASLVFAGAAAALSKPGKPAAKLPSGAITATKVTFMWGKAARATKYEVRVYAGSVVKLKKAAIGGTSWKGTTDLATDVAYTWKVRAKNAAGTGPWSSAKSFTITPAPQVSVGDASGGGKVAYVVVKGDPRWDPNIQHGLIAATADQSGTDAHWTKTRQTTSSGAVGTGLFDGAHNTDVIVALQGTDDLYAARIARTYTDGVYHDWYLPSQDELNKLYLAKDAIGGFQKATYWSSSDRDGYTVWVQFFDGGKQNYQYKEMRGTVRAVRAF